MFIIKTTNIPSHFIVKVLKINDKNKFEDSEREQLLECGFLV